MQEIVERPRANAREILRELTPEETWRSNHRFFEGLLQDIRRHPVFTHPALEVLNRGGFDRAGIRDVHLDYWHGGAQVFTDALLMAQFHARELEGRFGSRGKIATRFLLALNILDELGFHPGEGAHEEPYRGNPLLSHQMMFETVLDDLGVTPQVRRAFVPSAEAQALRAYVEESYLDLWDILVMLAVTEEEVMVFSPAMRQAARHVGVSVEAGYYLVHGTSEDASLQACDDEHQGDVVHILMHAVEPEQHAAIRQMAMRCCDLTKAFWDRQMQRLPQAVVSEVAG